ncbi:unnamed protein product [Calypogeia fissa]
MASEIEVVETPRSLSTPAAEGGESGDNSTSTNQQQEGQEQRRDDVYTAAAYGDLEKLIRLVEQEGCSVSVPDAGGYYALQWSALNDRAVAAQYLLEHGADANAADYTGQTALHWTAVRGSVQVAELLLQHGARLEAADSHGYRTSHVAAQYGHTYLLYYLVTKWSAEFDGPDNDSRSPLHWAAYKGFSDSVRLLLFMGAYLRRQDKEGCTPLHWAAIRGNLEACTVLVQAGAMEDLLQTESGGFTAAQLASDKGHRHVTLFLSNARRVFNGRWDSKGRIGKIARLGLAPVLWVLAISMVSLFAKSVIISSSLVPITASVGLWGWLVVFLGTGGLFLLYRCSSKDPGFVQPAQSDGKGVEDPLLSQANNLAIVAGYWAQLCPTCKIVRPVRSKHCASCNRCVEQFDHHCPWISNCVGKLNKWDFFIFLVMETTAMIIGAIVTIHRLYMDENAPSGTGAWLRHVSSYHPGALTFLVMDIFLLSGVATLTGLQATQIARNITTNEVANSMRYNYLKGVDGRFKNVYDHGIRKNCSEFLLTGFSSDVEVNSTSHVENRGGLIQMMEHLPGHRVHSSGNAAAQDQGNLNVASAVGSLGHAGAGHHVHSAGCKHNHAQGSSAPVGLGLGLGTSRPSGGNKNSQTV